jgi:dTDP-4-amino-4,6-dideoxygalactose transaminase
MRIPLIKPYITEEVKAKVCEVLDSGFLTEGSVTHEFENRVREYVGSQYALAVSNCTVGLELALRAMDIGPEDEVIIPDYTYPATGDAVQIVGAKVVIVDINPETCLMLPRPGECSRSPDKGSHSSLSVRESLGLWAAQGSHR